MACLEELITTISKVNSSALVLLGALLPSMCDSRWMVKEIIARNQILQKQALSSKDRKHFEYSRPGKVLLMKGGLIPTFFDEEGWLVQVGHLALSQAILDKFASADLVVRALDLHARGSWHSERSECRR